MFAVMQGITADLEANFEIVVVDHASHSDGQWDVDMLTLF
jgi:hypothetical protein